MPPPPFYCNVLHGRTSIRLIGGVTCYQRAFKSLMAMAMVTILSCGFVLGTSATDVLAIGNSDEIIASLEDNTGAAPCAAPFCFAWLCTCPSYRWSRISPIFTRNVTYFGGYLEAAVMPNQTVTVTTTKSQNRIWNAALGLEIKVISGEVGYSIDNGTSESISISETNTTSQIMEVVQQNRYEQKYFSHYVEPRVRPGAILDVCTYPNRYGGTSYGNKFLYSYVELRPAR